MKRLLALCLLCLTTRAFALEIAGVQLDNNAQVADASLELNGAGVRSVLIFKIYVAALYLELKTNRVDEVLADGGPKRLILVMERDQSGQDLADSINKGLAANNNAARMQALQTSIRDFSTLLEVAKEFKEGDVITIDYIPGYGTYVGINGAAVGHVDGGPEFYGALLRVWLGDNPVDIGLKKDLLGKPITQDLPGRSPAPNQPRDIPPSLDDQCCM